MGKIASFALAGATVVAGVAGVMLGVAFRVPERHTSPAADSPAERAAVASGPEALAMPRSEHPAFPGAELAEPDDGPPALGNALLNELRDATPGRQLAILERRLGAGTQVIGSDLCELAWDTRGGVVVYNPIRGTTLHDTRFSYDLSPDNVQIFDRVEKGGRSWRLIGPASGK